MPRTYITPHNLEGLSDEGRVNIRENAFYENRKFLGAAILLFIVCGGLGGHRFYLENYRAGMLISCLSIIIAVIVVMRPDLSMLAILYVFILMLVEIVNLKPAVEAFNRNLSQILDHEIGI